MNGNQYRGYDNQEPRVIALAHSKSVTQAPWGWMALAALTFSLMFLC